MDLVFQSLEEVSIALGAGSAFIFCFFFILSFKDHKIKPYEYGVLRRLSNISTISVAFATVAFIVNTSLRIEAEQDLAVSTISAKLIILAFLFIAEITLRKIHLPTLMRHQQAYFHLSDTMIHHPDPLVTTASFTIVSWCFVIALTSLDFKGMVSLQHPGFVKVALAYILLCFIVSKIALYFKAKSMHLK